jgi:hypothetical protein
MIAALFVERDGIYRGLDDVDVWDEQRDARLYAGPWPVVAHPPCDRWCVMAPFVESVHGLKVGDDGGCFEAALAAVRSYGGVLEHPASSLAWAEFGLPRPQASGGWTLSLFDAGASCYVEQGRYGLPMRKATWLYAFGVELPPLRWGKSARGSDEYLAGWRMRARYRGESYERAGHRVGVADRPRQARIGETLANQTPIAFRDVLLDLARSA